MEFSNIMPRKNLIRDSHFPYHISCRSNNKEWFYLPIQDVWRHCIELLNLGQAKFQINIHSFVLMNNHYHLLIDTPLANIDKFMQFFNKNLSCRISRDAGRINRIFGSSYKWTLIKSDNYYNNVFRYVYQNPVKAMLVGKCEDYTYSSLQQKIHKYSSIKKINLLETTLKFDLSWLNTPLGNSNTKTIKRGLKSAIYFEKTR